MADKSSERSLNTAHFAQARNELFSHILRCGVLEATEDHKQEWFDDTMEYLADRYDLSKKATASLRHSGEQYCRPVINRAADPDPTKAESETIGAAS